MSDEWNWMGDDFWSEMGYTLITSENFPIDAKDMELILE